MHFMFVFRYCMSYYANDLLRMLVELVINTFKWTSLGHQLRHLCCKCMCNGNMGVVIICIFIGLQKSESRSCHKSAQKCDSGAFNAERDSAQNSLRAFNRLIMSHRGIFPLCLSQLAFLSRTFVGHCSIVSSSIVQTPKILKYNDEDK